MIFLGCATIGRISRNRQLSVAIKDQSGPLSDIVEFVMAIALKQLKHVSRSESYKWHLKWATNHTMLSLAFTSKFYMCRYSQRVLLTPSPRHFRPRNL